MTKRFKNNLFSFSAAKLVVLLKKDSTNRSYPNKYVTWTHF